MKRLQNHYIGVDHGASLMFSDFEDGGPMWNGTGPRQVRQAITFGEAFRGKPVVTVSVSMWDIDQGSNQRADLVAENVSPRGFDLVFRTWGDTRVARIRASWMAIGPLSHDDDWDLS